jgi:hypothetical protein
MIKNRQPYDEKETKKRWSTATVSASASLSACVKE